MDTWLKTLFRNWRRWSWIIWEKSEPRERDWWLAKKKVLVVNDYELKYFKRGISSVALFIISHRVFFVVFEFGWPSFSLFIVSGGFEFLSQIDCLFIDDAEMEAVFFLHVNFCWVFLFFAVLTAVFSVRIGFVFNTLIGLKEFSFKRFESLFIQNGGLDSRIIFAHFFSEIFGQLVEILQTLHFYRNRFGWLFIRWEYFFIWNSVKEIQRNFFLLLTWNCLRFVKLLFL